MKRPLAPLVAVALAWLLACSSTPDGPTAVRVFADFDGALPVTQLSLKSKDRESRVPETPAPVSPGASTVLLLDDRTAETPLDLTVSGLSGGQVVAIGRVSVTPVLHATVEARASLARIPCGAFCTKGATACQGDGTKACEEREGCAAWSAAAPCPANTPYCSLGQCSATCVDECSPGSARCAGPKAIERCGQSDSDPCQDWVAAETCPDGTTCENGGCTSAPCTDECQAGAVQCAANGTSTCGQFDTDTCLEWGPTVPCPDGQTCSKGVCSTTCQDECTGATCQGLSWRKCGNFDLDACKELDPGTSCAATDGCFVGACDAAGGCTKTPVVCNSPPQSTCVDGNTMRVYQATGTCSKGACDYAPKDVACPNCPGCDACAGVTCNTPPKADCLDATTLRTYASAGACSGGTCSYAPTDRPCPGGCAGAVCNECPAGFEPVSGGCRDPLVPRIATREYTSCAIRADGRIACWGQDSGAARAPAGAFQQVSLGYGYGCGVRVDGTVACWPSGGGDGEATPPSGTFREVAAGKRHTCGIRSDGSLACWGSDGNGQSSPPRGSFRHVTSGESHSCALRDDGRIACWGYNNYGIATAPSGTFVALGAGEFHTCAVRTEGTLACWGWEQYGRARPPSGLFSSVAGGELSSCGRAADGTVWCWGSFDRGTSGQFRQVTVGLGFACVLRVDGTLGCWGSNTDAYGNDIGCARPPSGAFW